MRRLSLVIKEYVDTAMSRELYHHYARDKRINRVERNELQNTASALETNLLNLETEIDEWEKYMRDLSRP